MNSENQSDEFDLTQAHLSQARLTQIGRYQIVKLIGSGGFGAVYLANDEKLERQVAIKVPHEQLVQGSLGASEYLDEARMVANLDHPNIVPVFDVGSTNEIDCYVVSKYIQGQDLRKLLRQRKFDYVEAATLVATIADALHHAHKRGLVHRDVKPSNILIDQEGTPFVADFGLALPEQNLGKGPRFAGTPTYMSPEQARGEGHRVDGRSDIFSLGAVFHELATGKRAFRGESRSDVLDQIEHFEPRPLRQYDEEFPKELDRICQKALAKRASERYWTAHDMAEDIRAFLSTDESLGVRTDRRTDSATQQSREHSVATIEDSDRRSGDLSDQATGASSERSPSDHFSESQQAVVLPKGLRSFDAHDADFFLELLPGPKDRNGLPDSLRFWKTRIESRDADESFSVGMIYGPSGCGKSSFVNAGLIPQLSETIIPVFIESTADFTEQRLLYMLRKCCPDLDPELGLRDAVASIRRGQGIPPGKKVVLFFDQFERWLHSRSGEPARDLVHALRQCDGERIQAILMVRSDFWMSVTRLLNDLEVDLIQGQNFAAVDLFPPRHAKKVLIAFGRAYGALPVSGKLDKDQLHFINQSVEGLAQEGKLICVRLALYAEMMKNKPWTLASLNKIGGTEGVGVTFLEDSFGSQANPKIRVHRVAARRVLKSLLPDSSTTINIQMKSYEELFRDSGYHDSKQFDELIRVLDHEMRLISPTDPSGVVQEGDEIAESETTLDPAQKYFRLAHDYLVTALRKWLNRKLRETRRGRAELVLAERASFWDAKREKRYLPSIPEHIQIRALTSKNQWTGVEKAVMGNAAKAHGLLIGGALVAFALVIAGGLALRSSILEKQHERESTQLVEGLLQADTSQVAEAIVKLKNYRAKADAKLRAAFKNHPVGSREKLHAAMSLVSNTPEAVRYLVQQLPQVSADRFQPVCDSLKSVVAELPIEFAETLADPSKSPKMRLQSACAIAQFDSSREIWQNPDVGEFVAEELTRLYPSELAPLRRALRPVAPSITPSLRVIFLDQEREQQQRTFATESLVDYQADSPTSLFDLLLDCDERQFQLVFRALADQPDFVIEHAREVIGRKRPANDLSSEDTSRLITNQANAAVALFQLNQFEIVWNLLNSTDENPTLRSLIIHWLHNRGSNPAALLERLKVEKSGPILKALMFAIGEYPASAYDSESSNALVKQATELLHDSNTADVKAATQWLLRTMGHSEIVDEETKSEQSQQQQLRQVRVAAVSRIKENTPEPQPATDEDRQVWKTQFLKQPNSRLTDGASSDWLLAPLTSLAEVEEVAYPGEAQRNQIAVCAGPFGQALKFDGNTVANVTQAPLPDTSKGFSYGCWFRIGSDSQFGSLMSKMDPHDGMRGFDIWIEGNHVCAHLKRKYVGDSIENSFIKVIADKPVNDNQWHQVIVSYDGLGTAAGVEIFLDGRPTQLEIIEDSLNGQISNDSPLVIGGRTTEVRFPIRGEICSLVLVGRTLLADEVQENYLSAVRSLAAKNDSELDSIQQEMIERTFLADTKTESELDQKLNEFAFQQVSEFMNSERNWYYTGEGQMMVRVEAESFKMGNSEQQKTTAQYENPHNRNINRIFALSNTEVTFGQWKEFLVHSSVSQSSRNKFELDKQSNPNRPVVNASWIEAVHYCNWLNEREGIPESQWCYIPDPEKGYGIGMKVKPEFWKLGGYRLPTQAEWEFACRAGSIASRSYGNREALLGKYAWYQKNSSSPNDVGLLKPNQLGFFDMHGNAMEWCFDLHQPLVQFQDDAHDFPKGVGKLTSEKRELRGGAYYDLPIYVRAPNRYAQAPDAHLDSTGFRIARTLKNTVAGNDNSSSHD